MKEDYGIMMRCGIKLEPDKTVKVTVARSDCKLLPEGSSIQLIGPRLDGKDLGPVCVTALAGIYPWIMASRFGIESEKLAWNDGYKVCCPEGKVEFHIVSL
jgi:uncharacterized repeat protein (TIGR04076 family)